MRHILDEIIQKQQRYSASDRRHDEKNGEQSAALTEPGAAVATVDLLVEETLRDAELDAASYGRAAMSERARLGAEITHHQTRLDQELYLERQNAQLEREQNLKNLDAEIGNSSQVHRDRESRVRDAEDALTGVKARLTPRRRPLRVHWRHAFLPLMAFIAVIEMPLNQLSFEFVLRDIPAFAWLLALACGVILVFFAHLVGVWTRQLNIGQRKPLDLVFSVSGILTVASAALYLIFIISGLRQRFVNAQTAPTTSMAEGVLAEQSTLDQIADAVAAAAMDTTLTQVGWLIFGINVVFFLFGVLLAYYRHDPDPDYERAAKTHEAARNALTALQDKYQQRKGRLDESFVTHMAQLDQEINDAESRLQAAQGALDALEDRRAPDLRVIATCALSRATYRVAGFYQRAGQRGMQLPTFNLPSVDRVLARFEVASQHPDAAKGASQRPPNGAGLNAGRPPRPTGPQRDSREPPGASL